MGASGTLSVLSVLEVLYDDMVYKSATYLLTFSNLGLLGETIILSHGCSLHTAVYYRKYRYNKHTQADHIDYRGMVRR